MNVNTNNLIPELNENETKIIFQRHSNYDKTTGKLLDTEITKKVDYEFFKNLFDTLTDE